MLMPDLHSLFEISFTYFCTKHLIFWVPKCGKCVHIEKYVKMQCTARALKTVQKLSAEQWTLHTLNKRRTGDVEEITSQTSQLSKWWQSITTEDFRKPPTWELWMSSHCTDASYTCFCTKHHYVYCCQIAAISNVCCLLWLGAVGVLADVSIRYLMLASAS